MKECWIPPSRKSPCTVTAGNPYAHVTFSDADLLQTWRADRTGLELQEYYRSAQEDQNQLVGSPPPTVTVSAGTGEYSLYFTLGVTEIIAH